MVRVLHVYSYFRPDFTGEGVYLEKLAAHLQNRSISTEVVAAVTPPPRSPQTIAPLHNVRFFGSPGRRAFYVNWKMVLWFAGNIRKYDVVHFHAWVDRVFLYHLLAFVSCRPIIQSCTLDDSMGRHIEGYREFYRPLVRRLSRTIDLMVAISPKLYSDCLSVMPAQRVAYVPQGTNIPALEPSTREQTRAEWGVAENEIILLYVGSISSRKDILFLVENHAAISSPGRRVRLVIVGPDLESDYAATVRRKVAESSCGDAVSLVGYLDDPSAAYRAADIFVFASNNEGFGNVLIEAMSFGLPVVSRRLPDVTDRIVDEGKTGYLFDTATEYVESVNALVSDGALRTAVGSRARRTVVDQFDMCAVAGKYAEIYQRFAGQAPGPA
ncbi:MAG TPA: glycosyltransferase family 4 protein [Rhizomicrobium sp.]|jgi:glycosyltransferase involved in cell wall biosynthesis